jgi:SAM-dependent methyltransferase
MIKNTLHKAYAFIKRKSFYDNDLKELKRQKGDNTDFVFGTPYPILNERFVEAGTMSGHYFHQDLLIAQRIYINNPKKHVDIGSRIDGFVAHVASFRKIEIFDIRTQVSKVENIVFRQADLMTLPEQMLDYCDSISSLHAIEHFGLGRYGDPIDYYGHIKALNNIQKILKKGGKFYFSVPIGKQRIMFNAHRIFDVSYLLNLFDNKFKVDSFSYVDDKGDLFENVEMNTDSVNNNYNCSYGCGIFELTKI